MGWLRKIPKISLFLLISTYGVFGWLYNSWAIELIIEEQILNRWFKPPVALAITYGLGVLCIICLILFFTTPITMLTLGMDNWFRADAGAFFAIAFSIFIFAILVKYPVIFSHFLVLSAAAMLFRLDLQTAGCPSRFAQFILIILSLIAFALGLAIFNFYGL